MGREGLTYTPEEMAEFRMDLKIDLDVSKQMVDLLPEGNELRKWHEQRVDYLSRLIGGQNEGIPTGT